MKNEKESIQILGVKIDKREKSLVYRDIDEILNTRRGAKIFTPNGEILYKINNDEALKRSFNSASLSLPDGISVVLASRILGKAIPSRISGIDTAEYVLDIASRKGLSLYLLGGDSGIAERAAAKLKKIYTGLSISGTHHGFFLPDSEEEKEILIEIRKKAPDILFVCLGAPAQEKWIVKHSPSLPSLRLSMGLGGSLDVWSEKKKRAPQLMRVMGLEWLYRIASEPSRIKRLPNLIGFFKEAVEQALKKSTIKKEKRNGDYRV